MNILGTLGIISRPSLNLPCSITPVPILGQVILQTAAFHSRRKELRGRHIFREYRSRSFANAQSQASNMSTRSGHRVPIEPQRVDAPLTQSATFLVVTIANKLEAFRVVRSVLSDIDGLAKNVAIRDLNAAFACTVGIGSDAWPSLTRIPRPAELHPFPAVHGQKHTAVSTPGDLLFHIRSERRDLCFEFERQLLNALGSAVNVVDETTGFRYFDVRDLLGFVDGTANPVGPAVPDSVLVAEEDAGVAGGSFVVVQKYVHDVKAWNGLSTEQQEGIIGRRKLDNVELDDAAAGQQQSHKSLATIEDENGEEHDILRDNMPFGSPGSGEFGTYFIGYSRRLWVIEKMLQRMFIGDPPGLHDRLLDFSTPLTGTTFFAPSSDFLKSLDPDDD
ncbi:hypothetical protein GGS26DRAFT_454962 [Hypomontagnella submonticulosa]|nr:hypothetical protein GGS26DRAFT_454962 [Hypomontagnella submonticulosa]